MKHSFPSYIQHDAMDCGPTCLRMVAAHYGRVYSLEGLREKSKLTREGVSLLGIAEAAENIGFRTTGVKITFEQLMEAPLPCIVHWNQNHFVVLYRVKNKEQRCKTLFTHNKDNFQLSTFNFQLFVSDPAGGKVKFTKEEFCRCWCSSKTNGEDTGIALLLEPTPHLQAPLNPPEGGKQDLRSGLKYLFSYLRPYRNLIVQLFIGLLFGSMLQLILPFLTQSLVDFGISAQNIGYIWLVLVAQLVLTLSNTAVGFIRGWILLHLGTRVNIALISDFLAKLMRLPMAYFDTKMTGDIMQRMGDHSRIQGFLTGSSLSTLFSVFNLLIFGIVILIYSPLIFLIFFAGSLLYFLWIRLFMKRRAELDHKNFAQSAANQSNVIQLITGMQEIKLNACERLKRWEWERIQVKLFRLQIKGMALSQYQDSGAVLINQVKNIVITALTAKMVVDGQITLGMMMSIQYIIGQLNAPVDQLIGFMREWQDANLSLERLNEVQNKDDEEAPSSSSEGGEFFFAEGHIGKSLDLRFDNVSFAYDTTSVGERVLKDIDLLIPSGKQTAIVGTSGSGKTTLLKLLLGFYPVQKGEILLGESSLTNYSLREWRKRCGVVMQEGFIFSDTIARNIAPGDEYIDKELLLHAVTTANIREFVESLPLNYNTKIGSEGHGLSQGQKQRILIARAVYKNPDYVFFDEATNALDANNEHLIMNNLQQFFKGRTSVIVAHRLSTVKNADQIIVLENGVITEIGTHRELSDKKGAYYTLVKNQLEL